MSSLARRMQRNAAKKIAKLDKTGRDAVVKLAKDNSFIQATADNLVKDLDLHFRQKQAAIETQSLGAVGTIIYWCLFQYFDFKKDKLQDLTERVKEIVSCFRNSGTENSFVGLTLQDLKDGLRDEAKIEMVGVNGVLPYILGGKPLIHEMLEQQVAKLQEQDAPVPPVAEPVKQAEPEPVEPEPVESTKKSKFRKCAFCGDTFEAKHKLRVYCSDLCRARSYRRRKLQKEKAAGGASETPSTA